MTRLNELLCSLTTVLIRYHDCQTSDAQKIISIKNVEHVLIKQYRKKATELLAKNNFKETLKFINEETTNGYHERSHLVQYLLDQIVFLKAFQDRTQSCNTDDLAAYKKAISHLFIDLNQLTYTPKGEQYHVKKCSLTNDIATVTLNGLTRDGILTSNYLCTSGSLIKAEILDRFNISREDSDEPYSIAEQLCDEHQNILLVPELREQVNVLRQKKGNHLLFSGIHAGLFAYRTNQKTLAISDEETVVDGPR